MLRHPAVIRGVTPGQPYPQGATYTGAGTNFALYSEHAERVELCLFDDDSQEHTSISLPGRTHNVWHGFVPGVGPGQRYGYRVFGPFAPERGHYFNPNKLLVDPYARALDRVSRWHPEFQNHEDPAGKSGWDVDSAAVATRAVVVDDAFDWEDAVAPRVPWRDTVIYECHVKGLTQLHPAVPAELRGTYRGLASAPVIEHLKALGVTTLELLPVAHAFSERSLVQRGLSNYWGYNTLAYFAPDVRFACTRPGELVDPVADWKTMVRALHRAGIEVIVDVVYNHSGEADPSGPLLSLRGIDNSVYYRLSPLDQSRYVDTTGCGNSLNFEHPQTQRLVMDSLRYWVTEMHVDGFRFDLAPTLARGAGGLDLDGRFFAMLAQDPVFAHTKLIVEPWDLGPDGLRTGGFRAGYAEWNGYYRDALRRFFRGEAGQVAELATRVAGSSDLFGQSGRGPLASINYVTCHDGRSLYDLVSYEGKYNHDNGWDNRDGADEEYARNWGAEGPTDRPETKALRARVMRGFMLSLAVSQGVPMLRQGDEFGQSQRGNNNAYTQDNAVSYVDWKALERADALYLYGFVRAAFGLRRALPELRRSRHLQGERPGQARDVTWLRPDGAPMQPEDFHDRERRTLGMWLSATHDEGSSVLVLWNAEHYTTTFQLPSGVFELRLDSAEHLPPGAHLEHAVHVQPHSCVLLTSRPLASAARRVPRELDGDLLVELAGRYGIADSYVGYSGQLQRTSHATRVTLLGAMGVDAGTTSACRAALDALDAEERSAGLAPVRVLPVGADALRRCELRVHEPGARLSYRATLQLESGESLVREGHVRDPRAYLSLPVPSHGPLPAGYHELRVSVSSGHAAEREYTQQLIVTPRACPPVSALIGERRGAGLWAHVYALHSERGPGLGDLGDLRALVAFAADQQLDFVGVNPLHAVDNYAGVVSPYYPLSRVFGNPLYLELEAIPEFVHSESARRLLSSPQLGRELAQLRDSPRRDYAAAWRLKLPVLRALHASFVAREQGQSSPRARAYAEFVELHGHSLRDFATFCAIAEALASGPNGAPIYDWAQFPTELRDVHSSAVAQLRQELAEPIAFHMYLQFELSRQIEAAQREARTLGLRIGLYGDLAVGNAAGAADVWAHPDLFARGVELGAPPDAYSAVGQSWGLLPLKPRALIQDRFQYMKRLARSAVRSAGMLRIDHVMGLTRQFWVPNGSTALEGGYVRFPFEELCGILALEASRTQTLVIGEDLGVVPAGLRERMSELGLLRSQVVCFERDDDGSFKAPSRYAPSALATVNTHDLPPLLAYFDALDVEMLRVLGIVVDGPSEARLRGERAAAKAALLDLLRAQGLLLDHGYAVSDSEWTVAVHQLLARVESVLVAASLDDLCLEVEPLNVPGVASAEHPSWAKRMRLSVEALARDEGVLRSVAALRARQR